jgi:hypothetical protein
MRPPQITLKGFMILIATIAIAVGLARWSLALALIFVEAVVAYPVVTTAPDAPFSKPGFDDLLGVAGPSLCLIIDPLLFQGGDEHGPILDGCRTFCYGFIGVEMAILVLWLCAGPGLGRACGFVSGAMGVGAVFAACLGLLILPFSLMGLVIGIGALGIIPFLVARTFYSQSKASADAGRASLPPWRLRILQAVGAALSVGLPVVIQLT